MNGKEKSLRRIPLSKLELDSENPRFGANAGKFADQADVLDYLVDSLGVDSLLPSLAISGYFDAEPMVVKEKGNGNFVVVEGNRRLAACLILAKDDRARNQVKKSELSKGYAKVNWTTESLVPVEVFSNDDTSLLPYLGVRHIVSAQPWDSYAKAKWVSDVVSKKLMTLEQIVEVIGDDNRTINRMLEGFNFIEQLKRASLFQPDDSVRSGRGSNPAFPFSWVYTLLGYPGVRAHLGLSDLGARSLDPVPAEKLPEAAEVVGWLFGSKRLGRNSAIPDSRNIGALANAVAHAKSRELLRQGKRIPEIEELSRPAADQLSSCLALSESNLGKAVQVLAAAELSPKDARALVEQAATIRRLASEVYKRLSDAQFVDDPNA